MLRFDTKNQKQVWIPQMSLLVFFLCLFLSPPPPQTKIKNLIYENNLMTAATSITLTEAQTTDAYHFSERFVSDIWKSSWVTFTFSVAKSLLLLLFI